MFSPQLMDYFYHTEHAGDFVGDNDQVSEAVVSSATTQEKVLFNISWTSAQMPSQGELQQDNQSSIHKVCYRVSGGVVMIAVAEYLAQALEGLATDDKDLMTAIPSVNNMQSFFELDSTYAPMLELVRSALVKAINQQLQE